LTACDNVKKKLGHYPTHFEALTAIAFCYFKEQKVDWVVLEVGLGGRLDSTNVIQNPAVSLITPIGLEHQAILGKTIGKITGEKAGIIKPGEFVATVQYQSEAYEVIEKVAKKQAALLWKAGRDFSYRPTAKGFRWAGPGWEGDIHLSATPRYQMTNAALALAGIQYLRTNDHLVAASSVLQNSFSAMRWPGRVEVVSLKPLILLDGAHNPDGAMELAAYLQKNYAGKKWIVLNGLLKDKDQAAFVKALKPVTALAVVTEPNIDRAENGETVFAHWENQGSRALLVKDWERALTLARSKANGIGLLVTGSLYLVGDARRVLVGIKGLEAI
jgi:dihydrofolate synthase/folylpolyglutamate synthase